MDHRTEAVRVQLGCLARRTSKRGSRSRPPSTTADSPKDIEDRLWKEIHDNGGARLISEDDAEPGLKHLTGITGLTQMVGSLMLLLWLVMMICQGEGMELDLNRRRHPMWEWLLSHPVQPGAVFLAEMLMPISANSIYWFGPVYVGVIYGLVYGLGLGILAGIFAGIPAVTIGAACLGKAIEIGVMIRFSPRSRGGILGILSWLGYALLLFSFAGFYMLPRLIMASGKLLSLLASFPWPWLQASSWAAASAANTTSSTALPSAGPSASP